MKAKINAAIVGFGMSGEYFHAAFLDANPNFKLKKVLERHTGKSKLLYPYVELVRDFPAVLEDPEIDLVIINTPNYLHYEMSKKALLAGKHVVIEKPFTITSAEAAELIEIASRNQKILTVYHNRRWDGDFLTVKKIIENKMLGELVEYESHFDRFRNFIKPGSWKEENLPGNGLLYDIGSHLIDQAVLLFDTPISIFADLRVQRLGGKIIDSFELILDYKNLKVTLKSNFLSKTPLPRFILHGTEGSFIKEGLDTQEDELKKRGYKNSSEWGKEPVELWGRMDTKVNGLNFKGKIETIPGSYQSFYDDLYESIMNGKELSVKPEDAMNTIRIIELAMESKKRKCTIDLSDYPE